MTKYVLNSGGMRGKPELSRQFFGEGLEGLGEKPKVLLCYFASLREDWEGKYQRDTENISSLVPSGVAPAFEMALPDSFNEQVKNADAIHIHGGDDHLLRYWLQPFDIPHIFEGKTVGASSAGSNVLVTHFWTCDWRECGDGLGILPIKFISHYKSDFGANDPRGPIDWDKALEELKAYGDTSLPIHALEEGRFTVIEK